MKKLSLIGLTLIITIFMASAAMANFGSEKCKPKATATCSATAAGSTCSAVPATAKKCPTDCKKPCCAKKTCCGTDKCPKAAKKAACGTAACPKSAKKCPVDCKKPCCAKKATCGTDKCPKTAKKCPADCKKPCCAKKATCGTDKCPKTAKKCPADCKKPCCAKKATCGTDKCPKTAKKCPVDCKKPCCAKKATCGTDKCPKTAKTCPADCKKPCCAKKATCGTDKCPKTAKKCPADCKKPCCAKKATCGTDKCPKTAKKCPVDCKKPCCAKKATCGTDKCPKTAKKCPADCKKPCCVKKSGCPNNPVTCSKAIAVACPEPGSGPCPQALGKKCGIACAKPCCGGVALFDGKTLNGFIQRGGKAKYEVKDGVIIGTTVPKTPNSFMCTEKNYSDFVLHVDFKVDEELNSGVQIRSNSLKDYKDGRVHGYQVEIDPSQSKSGKANVMADGSPAPKDAPRSWTGGIYDEGRRGWLNNLTKNPKARNAFKPGKWNHFMVVAKGDSIKTWINGVPAADLKDGLTKEGFIALQVHGTKSTEPHQVMWKNIYLKEIKAGSCSTATGTCSK